jgi:hypothetical protein
MKFRIRAGPAQRFNFNTFSAKYEIRTVLTAFNELIFREYLESTINRKRNLLAMEVGYALLSYSSPRSKRRPRYISPEYLLRLQKFITKSLQLKRLNNSSSLHRSKLIVHFQRHNKKSYHEIKLTLPTTY